MSSGGVGGNNEHDLITLFVASYLYESSSVSLYESFTASSSNTEMSPSPPPLILGILLVAIVYITVGVQPPPPPHYSPPPLIRVQLSPKLRRFHQVVYSELYRSSIVRATASRGVVTRPGFGNSEGRAR